MVCIIGFFLYTAIFMLSLGPFVWVYNAEILPDAGVSISTSVNWWSNTIVGFSPILIGVAGNYTVFWIFFVIMMISNT